MRILISKSMRQTWVWAPDAETATQIKALLGSGAREAMARGKRVPLAWDIDIGVDAYEAMGTLLAAGHTLHWHPDVPEVNRISPLWGVDIAD